MRFITPIFRFSCWFFFTLAAMAGVVVSALAVVIVGPLAVAGLVGWLAVQRAKVAHVAPCFAPVSGVSLPYPTPEDVADAESELSEACYGSGR